MQDNMIAQPELATEGQQRIDWVRRHMPILRHLEEQFSKTRPFEGVRIVVSIHLEAKTAYLALVLKAGGAKVAVTGSNPDSTKDNVAAALAEAGLHVYAIHGADPQAMRQYMNMALDLEPNIVIDDGGDIVEILHDARTSLLEHIYGACEETTTGVLRALARERTDTLSFPILLINEARCKYLFDNVHGTGQSVWDAVMRSTNLVLAGKTITIVGFGWCGRGCALRAQGLGAHVIICEVDPIKAADALMQGFRVMPLNQACGLSDVILTVTGVRHTIDTEHFAQMKDGVLLANAGHFWDEINVPALKSLATEQRRMREQVEGFLSPDGRWVHLLGDGHIVNIACGDGHPAEIMDMSFALQALCAQFLVQLHDTLSAKTYRVPEQIDQQVAQLKLSAVGIQIDQLSTEQRQYLQSNHGVC